MASSQPLRSALSITKKYTLPSSGIWERIRRFFVLDPNRSNGVPLNARFRNPPPGSNPAHYDEPVTVPAGDIAENPYWRRDTRRAYPRISFVSQKDVVARLTAQSEEGEAAAAKGLASGQETRQEGEKQQQVQVVKKEAAEERGLSEVFQRDVRSVGNVLGPDGMPPFPVGSRVGAEKRYGFALDKAYPEG
ncbi:MAG: hypothetical protein M1816_007457 [Peltula sp. TS41687]|nr:MAG: hypothetical protein M1816_007457 [Peltula sp. TS41687]